MTAEKIQPSLYKTPEKSKNNRVRMITVKYQPWLYDCWKKEKKSGQFVRELEQN